MVRVLVLKRRLGAKILRAVASVLRLNILRLLYDRGPLSYTEIMNYLKLSPSRDAGRFAYHLKTLLNMDLISPDPSSKKYCITELGRSLVEFADDLENSAYREQMLVRTSSLRIERFDRNKIAEALVREAEVPADLAHRIAREAERRLLKLGTKYLTAPLIREFVNSILIERGLEEYRHKMTRLGFPVYDVTVLMKEMSGRFADVEKVQRAAGKRVIEEYALINALPREVADAHLSGEIHIENLGCWVLKPSVFMHDARMILRRGIIVRNGRSGEYQTGPPKTLRSALNMLCNALLLTGSEVSSEQGLDYFNVFLAPFVKGLTRAEVKEAVSLFISSISLTAPTNITLGLETSIPSFLAEAGACGPGGEEAGVYGDFLDEVLLLASIIMECIREDVERRPLFNPAITIKLRHGSPRDAESQELISQAHELAVHGIPYFANLTMEGQEYASYVASGFRWAADWKEDWEIDAIRTGCMDTVTLNLPRAAYESEGEEDGFFELIGKFTEKGLTALRIKHQTVRSRANEGLLPFLLQQKDGDQYFRIENASSTLSFVGLNEATQLITKEAIQESPDALGFAENLSDRVREYSKRTGMRLGLGLAPSFEAARRLAQLDVEMYGLGVVLTQGERENPYYTNLNVVPHHPEMPLDDYLDVESRFHRLAPGAHLAKICLNGLRANPEELASTTERILERYPIGLYAYDRPLAYCSNCHRLWHGERLKCPACRSVKTLTRFRRQPARYKAMRP
ncbi:MAG: ribonucleoside triphosphate reductase [Candidatus Bathyarchaeota archaeon B63]|nr:MAG: ribonucleoside triphosphate reductase [Candidatus Bathyarchaeota archaeon B63]